MFCEMDFLYSMAGHINPYRVYPSENNRNPLYFGVCMVFAKMDISATKKKITAKC
jgi:hypothetical protein